MAAKKACHHVATKKPHAPWRLKGILLCGCHTPTLGTRPPVDLGCVPVAPQLWVPVPQWTWGASQPHPHLHLGYWAPNGPMTPFGPDCCGTVAVKERKKEKQHCSSTKHSLHCGSTNNTLPCGSSKNTQHSGSTKIGSNTKNTALWQRQIPCRSAAAQKQAARWQHKKYAALRQQKTQGR